MHELSIACAVLEQVAEHLPPRAVLRRVHLTVGPLRAIEPEAMRFAWQAATRDTAWDGSELALDLRPWSWRCRACGGSFESDDLDAACACGSSDTMLQSDDALLLQALDVDDPAAAEADPAAAAAAVDRQASLRYDEPCGRTGD